MPSILEFPNIMAEGYEKTSEFCWDYNCIAYAVGDQENWWWPYLDLQGNEGYWPAGVPRNQSLSSFTKAFKVKGFKICSSGELTEGFEKIAIYVRDGKATHAAKQLPTGQWSHKLGVDIDVTASLKAVEGPVYGRVARFMSKSIA